MSLEKHFDDIFREAQQRGRSGSIRVPKIVHTPPQQQPQTHPQLLQPNLIASQHGGGSPVLIYPSHHQVQVQPKKKSSILKWIIIGALVIVIIVIICICIRRCSDTNKSIIPENNQDWDDMKIDRSRYKTILRNSQKIIKDDEVTVGTQQEDDIPTLSKKKVVIKPPTEKKSVRFDDSTTTTATTATTSTTPRTAVRLPTHDAPSVSQNCETDQQADDEEQDPNFTPLDMLVSS